MNLYKYTSSNLWKNILQNKQIRFTQAQYFNDPFELKPFYESIAETEEFKKQLNEPELNDILENQFKEAYKELPPELQAFLPPEFLNEFAKSITPFAIEEAPSIMDALIMPSLSTGLNKGFGEHLGILSLTEKRDNLLMWAHYAENHRGFVVGFNSENEFFHHQRSENDELRHIRKVQYSEGRAKVQITSLEDMTDILLTKSKEWEYEQEWRMFESVKDATETKQINGESIGLFSFPATCVTEIILGCRMLPYNKQGILDYLASDEQYSHVEKYEAILDERECKINIIPVGN